MPVHSWQPDCINNPSFSLGAVYPIMQINAIGCIPLRSTLMAFYSLTGFPCDRLLSQMFYNALFQFVMDTHLGIWKILLRYLAKPVSKFCARKKWSRPGKVRSTSFSLHFQRRIPPPYPASCSSARYSSISFSFSLTACRLASSVALWS